MGAFMKLGTKETKELLGFILKVANAFGQSLEDGKVTIGDVSNFVDPILCIGDAFANASEIPSELCDLDDEERADLLAYAKETLLIPETCIEEIIESSFDVISELHILVQKIKTSLPVKPQA